MSKIFYFGLDNKVYGPVNEVQAQNWYAAGYFSSDIRFQISVSDRYDPSDRVFTLGELIERNSRTLPFYFSRGAGKDDKDQEELLNSLLQEVESLRVAFNEKEAHRCPDVDRGTVEALRQQVASLVESHTDLRSRFDALSAQKDNGQALAKKVNELKRRVDEQEKNQTAMKKEISAVTSKCERNDSKLTALLEKQRSAETMSEGFDQRISELKNSEKSIRDSLKSCEEATTSGSTQLESIKKDLGQIRAQMDKDQKDLVSARSEVDTVKRDLHEMKGAIKRDKQLQQPAAPVADSAKEPWLAEDSDIPPWDRTGKTVKKRENAPWDPNQTQKEVEPWAQMNGAGQMESVQAVKSVKGGVKMDQNVGKKGAVQDGVGTTTEGVQPISRSKNWDAICRDLSSDEEEEKEEVPIMNANHPHELQDAASYHDVAGVIGGVIKMIRRYVTALSERTFDSFTKEEHEEFARVGPVAVSWRTLDSREFAALAAAIEAELPKLTQNARVVCWECLFHLFTPVNLVDHLSDPIHVGVMIKELKKYPALEAAARYVGTLLSKFSKLLKRADPDERELALRNRGAITLSRHKDRLKYRPTDDFARGLWFMYVLEIRKGKPACLDEDEPWKDLEVLELQKNWFCKNKRRILGELEAHIATGVAYCDPCNVAYESVDDYYKHIATYGHIRQGNRLFDHMVRLCRGSEDWDLRQ